MPRWKFTSSVADAAREVKSAIGEYPPGQRGIDGGGFKVFKEDVGKDSAYFYVQFESARKGCARAACADWRSSAAVIRPRCSARLSYDGRACRYIDDVEFSLHDGVADVRTSSRQGYLDLGVNAKRFNWFAQARDGRSM